MRGNLRNWGIGFAFMLAMLSSCRTPVQASVAEKQAGVEQRAVLRNLLLEEFTAIHCSYCPSGHAIAQNMHRVLGERFQIIGVHTGSLAVPGGNEPDFRTEAGAAWYERQGSTGMPSGALNRHVFEGLSYNGYALGRGDWQEAARRSMNDTAVVNLYMEATLDTQTRLLSVYVEYFYPKQPDMEFNTLTLALTESYIPGTQSGSEGGAQYLHRHVLRDVLTPAFGDTLYNIASGQVLSKTYQYQIPEQYVNRAPVFANLEMIAFMSDMEGDILNSTACRVEYEGRYAAPHIYLSAPALARRYSRTAIPVYVENLGTDTLRSLSFSVEWGKQTYTPAIEGLAIPYAGEAQIEVPLGEYEFAKVTTYRITVKEANGKSVDCNVVSGYISEPYTVQTDKVKFELTTDEYGQDITYALYNRHGKVIEQGGPFENGEEQTYSFEWELQKDSVYSLEIKDAFMDGFIGGYKLLDAQGETVVWERSVGMYGDAVSFVYRENVANEPLAVSGGQPQMILSYNPVPDSRPDNEIRFDGFGSGALQLSVFDVQGREVFAAGIRTNTCGKGGRYVMDTKRFVAGFYFVRLTDGERMVVQKMLIL